MPTLTTPTTDTLVELLSHLIRFPTVSSDHATNRAALDWVEQQLDGLPLHIKRFESRGVPSLVATTRPTKSPKLWLVAHMDVVPDDADTYKPVVRDGKVHGRGAHDMKFAIAIFIALLQDLAGSLPEYDLGLMVTTDEEVGGYDGVRHLLDDQGYRGGAVLIPDCNANWTLETGAKGIAWYDLTAQGQTVHASRTWQGTNAIDELYRFIGQLRHHIPAEPCGDPAHQHATLNLGTISGGTAANAVPHSATARIDIRFTTATTAADLHSWIEAAHLAVPSVKAKNVVMDPPYSVPVNGPVTRFSEIVEEVTGHGLKRMVAHGSSDARHFSRHKIPTLNVCPTGSGYHIPQEWVDIADLGRFYEVTKRFAQEYAR